MKKLLILFFLFLILVSGHVQGKECLKSSECSSNQICKAFSCIEKVTLTKDEFKLLSKQMSYVNPNKTVIMLYDDD